MLFRSLAVLFGENVVGDRGDAHLVSQLQAELKHERRLPASDWPAAADGESAFVEIPVQRTISVVKMSRVIEMFMGVATRSVRVMV